MAVGIQTTRWGGPPTNGSSKTFSVNAGSNSDRLMAVLTVGYGAITITSVTYAGAGLTNSASAGGLVIWTKTAPATGSNNVVVTFSSYGKCWNAELAAYDVDQTTPIGTPVSAGATSTAPSTGSITVPTGGIAFGGYRSAFTSAGAPSPGGGFTNIGAERETAGGNTAGAGYLTATGPINYTIASSAVWNALGVPINPVAAAGLAFNPLSQGFNPIRGFIQ